MGAVGHFTATPPFLGCLHVVRDRAGATLCAQHSAAGFQCARCYDRHVRRHDEAEERTCDECRCEVEDIHPLIVTGPLAGGPIRDPKGHHRMFAGTIAIFGVGACKSCQSASGRIVVDIPTALLAAGWRP